MNFFGGVRGGGEGRGARLSEFFYKESKSKPFVGGRGGGVARASEYFYNVSKSKIK